jgi:uncharacterized membrane protein
MRLETMNTKLKLIIGCALGLIAVGCLLAAWYLDDKHSLNFLLCIFGAVFGLAVGILIRPHTDEEAKEVSEYGSAIITFVLGFLVGRIDEIFKATFNPAQTDMELLVSKPQSWVEKEGRLVPKV